MKNIAQVSSLIMNDLCIREQEKLERIVVDEGVPLEELCCDSPHNPIDELNPSCSCKHTMDNDDNSNDGGGKCSRFSEADTGNSVGAFACTALPRDELKHKAYIFPCHILSSFAGE